MPGFKKIISVVLLSIFQVLNGHAQSNGYADSIIRWQIHYKQEFIQNPQSPLSSSEVHRIEFFTPNPAFRIRAHLIPSKNLSPITIRTEDGQTQNFIKYGILQFSLNNRKLQLTLFRSVSLMQSASYRNLLFLPFYDKTNGTLTYEGGRYVDIDLRDIKNQQVIIDFNKAYNPYCAYSGGYSCPLPPPGNSLPIKIYAGELAFKK